MKTEILSEHVLNTIKNKHSQDETVSEKRTEKNGCGMKIEVKKTRKQYLKNV